MAVTELSSLKKAATELKKHVAKADSNRDGKLSKTEVKSYGRTVDAPVSKALETMHNWAMADQDRSAFATVTKVKKKIDDAIGAITKKDTNRNGKIDRSEQAAAEQLKTFKALAALAAHMDRPEPTGRLTAAQLKAAIAADSEIATYITETDGYPEFLSTPLGATDAINEENVTAALGTWLSRNLASLDEIACEAYTPRESAEFVDGLMEPTGEDSYRESEEAWARLIPTVKANLSDIRVFKYGPRNTDGSLAQDSGGYKYIVVGRSTDGKLAGFALDAAET